MSRRRRLRKRKDGKKLAYGVIALAFILACFLAYFSLHPDQKAPPEAAIVDQLSFREETKNQTFVRRAKEILEKAGYNTVKYYPGENVTVNFYRNLPSYATRLIILRVHSAAMRTENENVVGLFTSERYYGPADAYTKYPEDVEYKRLVEAFFSEAEREEGISYYGIVPKFVEESMKGEFKNTVIIMMGCEGLGYNGRIYTDMAEAFIKKGAKVYIGWDKWVSVTHADQATIQLLQNLILKNQTIMEAVEQISPDPKYGSKLRFYPAEVGNDRITNLSSSTSSIFETSAVCVSLRRLRVRSFHKLGSYCWVSSFASSKLVEIHFLTCYFHSDHTRNRCARQI